MKIARLPDGTLKEFPPDMPDDEMDRQVRSLLGVPEPPDPNQMLMQVVEGMMQQLAQMSQTLAQVAAMMQANGQAQDQSLQVLAEGFNRLEAAFRAPRSLVTDKNGKPLGVRVGQ